MSPFVSLLVSFFDDASQFPPRGLALEPAVEAHTAWRRDPRVGRFLLPADRAEPFASLADGRGFEVGLVVKEGGVEAAAAALAALRDHTVTAVELSLPDDPDSLASLGASPLFLETDAGGVTTVASVAGARAKLRCGGLSADAFPSVEAVAGFVGACAQARLPFKATAGLHEPLRHFDPVIGVHHHGFVNLWVATALALRGEPAAPALEVTEAGAVALGSGSVRFGPCELAFDELRSARELFGAFGTCSIEEPLEGLATLGLADLAVA